MAHKRKRSVSEYCASPSSVSSFDSPPRVSNSITNPFAVMAAAPIHLHSRTMKRFRDNRPSEEIIHQRTLNMLYSAQNQHQHAEFPSEQTQTTPQPTQPESNQQSLHRFWNISSTPSASTSNLHQAQLAPSNCDDCGAGLSGGDDGMDIDGLSNEDHSCGACGKHVCFSCSVSNLGEQRRCLQCAGRNDRPAPAAWNGLTASIF
ncbi:ORF21 protein [Fusarium austroafricanum]|uniref:ORF21 protein n=1 Tax=Fusarium austroafricanum TaxID=2364996 RepID=A0A8H4KDR0_9HYPO|nr:ORF21 protein [Fusarium austroafricanum]